MERYLKTDMDFYGQKVKFKARTGCLGVGADLKRWKKGDGICTACTLEVQDTLEHRLLFCSADIDKRLALHKELQGTCGPHVLSHYIQLGTNEKINWLLGEGAYDTWGHEIGNLFDKCSKLFLVSVYNNIKERSGIP